MPAPTIDLTELRPFSTGLDWKAYCIQIDGIPHVVTIFDNGNQFASKV